MNNTKDSPSTRKHLACRNAHSHIIDPRPGKYGLHTPVDENGNFLDSRTKQDTQDQCDINSIIKKYDKHQIITHVNNTKAQYGDFTIRNEYKENMEMCVQAQQSFDELPSQVRKQFHNDPGEFIEFVTNPKNLTEMVKLGLARAPRKPYKAKPKEKVTETPKKEETPSEEA